jgi:2,5-diketo-D-gluconate reductase A
MVEFANFNRIKPMVNQIETHILNQQKVSKE